MRGTRFFTAGIAAFATLISFAQVASANGAVGSGRVKHVLLLSIDGMHAVDFYNCSHGIAGVNDGNPYCPNLAALSHTRNQLCRRRLLEALGFLPGLGGPDHRRLAKIDRTILRRGL